MFCCRLSWTSACRVCMHAFKSALRHAPVQRKRVECAVCAGGGGSVGGAAAAVGGAAGGAGMRSKRACAADVPPAVHAVSVWCETDIFEAVGLHYVPPHMRHFHGVSS